MYWRWVSAIVAEKLSTYLVIAAAFGIAQLGIRYTMNVNSYGMGRAAAEIGFQSVPYFEVVNESKLLMFLQISKAAKSETPLPRGWLHASFREQQSALGMIDVVIIPSKRVRFLRVRFFNMNHQLALGGKMMTAVGEVGFITF